MRTVRESGSQSDVNPQQLGRWVLVTLFLLCILTGGWCYGRPVYRVWSRGMEGKSQLAEAEWNRRIRIQEAEAAKEAALHLADADTIRARGVASTNLIIGQSLNEPYLRYLWITGLKDGKNEVIYIPTEAGLPILEATRRLQRANEE